MKRKAKPKCDFCSNPAVVERHWSDDFETFTKELRCDDHRTFATREWHAYENIAELYVIVLKELAGPPTDGGPYLYLKKP